MSENECHRPGIEYNLCVALDFDLSHSWLSMAFEVLSTIIHVIIAVAFLFASIWLLMETSLIHSDICFGFQTCATVSIGLPAICLS